MEEFDYVIVGAGSAGCLLADRLSAPGDASVLVLEAGGPDRDPLIHVPLGIGLMHERRSHDWGFDTEPEPGLGGRAIEAMRGKVAGGSSSINHMSHVRGNPGDYDRWAAAGLEGWSYSHVLPYFKRYECWEGGADPWRGADGPLSVIAARRRDPIFDAFIEAAESIGIRYTSDHNGARQEGIANGQSTIRAGRRHSAYRAFLRRALGRPNATLRLRAHATRVLLDGRRARGIEYVSRGRARQVHAAREVILAGGVFNSPHLLMLSGIGPADELRRHGIAPVIDSPRVGANLQDHIAAMLSYERPVPGAFQRELRFDRMALGMLRAYALGTGPATVLPGGMHAYVRTTAGLDSPDIQLIFRAVSSHPHLWFPGIRAPNPDRCGVRPILLHPRSRGRLALVSSDPFQRPRVHQNFFDDPRDMETLIRGVRLGREIMAAAPLAPFRGRELAPGADASSDEDIADWVRRVAATAHHPACTCAMGAHEDAVLDGELRVRGAENLRVVDASAMPDLVSGNINACVLMIAEKASDHVLGRAPLAPERPRAPQDA